MNFITELLNQYGYVVLYLALLLELLGLPLPGEILMTYCGFLVLQGKLNFIICILFIYIIIDYIFIKNLLQYC